MKITDFAHARTVLAAYMPTSVQQAYTLDRQLRLMEYLDNPQDRMHVVHVAGTSGKTSTAYYAAALLKAAGHHVGLTVSPHINEVNERVQVDLVPLPEREFCDELGVFIDIVEESNIKPTYFELLIGFVYWYFARRRLEYAVIEVGLGGLLDGTNVITREDKVCIITDLGLDHMHVLGNTIGEIATQKAGIIQLHNTVFCYEQSPEVMAPIRTRAAQKQAELRTTTQHPTPEALHFLPLFQQRNFGLSRAAIEYVLARDGHPPLDDVMILQAAHTVVPGRMETFGIKGKTVILDGAHNAQKMHALVASIQEAYPNQPVAALIASVEHGAYRLDTVAAELAPLVRHAVVTTFQEASDQSHRSLPTEIVRKSLIDAGITGVDVIANTNKAWEALLARPEPVLLVTGSLYLLGHMRTLAQAAI